MKKDGFTTGDFRKASSSKRGRQRRWDTQKAGRWTKVVPASPRRLPRLKTRDSYHRTRNSLSCRSGARTTREAGPKRAKFVARCTIEGQSMRSDIRKGGFGIGRWWRRPKPRVWTWRIASIKPNFRDAPVKTRGASLWLADLRKPGNKTTSTMDRTYQCRTATCFLTDG